MIAPDPTFWRHLFTALTVEVCCLAALGFAAQWLARSAYWRRTIWQITVVCLLAAAMSEWTGVGRVLAEHFDPWPQAPMADPPFKSSFPYNLINHIDDTVESEFVALPPVLVTVATPPALLPPAPPPPSAVRWPGLLALAGTLLLLARTALAQGILFAMRFGRNRITDGPLPERLACLLPRLGLRGKVSLRRMSALVSPMAFGIVRPSIGLPAQFETKFSPAEQDAVLAHELAHLAARDPLWFLLADLAVAVLWWHPATWWARQRLHILAEQAADEATALVPGGPKALAQCLVALGREMADMGAWGWVGVNGGGFRSKLGRRVETLLQLSGCPPPPPSGRGAARIAALLVAAPLTVLAFGSWQAPRESSDDSWRSQFEDSWRQSPAGVLLLARRNGPPPQNQPSQAESVTPSTNQENKAADTTPSDTKAVPPYTTKLKLNYQNIRQQLAQLGLDPTNTAMLHGQIRQLLTVVGVAGKEDGTSISFNDPLEEMEIRTHSSNDLKIVTETMTQLNRSLNKFPPSRNQNPDIAVRLQNAKFLYATGKYDEAETMLRQIIKDDPYNPTAPYFLDLIKEARYMDAARQREFHKRNSLPVPIPMWSTNLVYKSKGRQRILSRLDSIVLDEVSFTRLPLKEVLATLRKESVAHDPEGTGVNFMINASLRRTNAFITEADYLEPVDVIENVEIADRAMISISPPLHKIRLADVLDAVVKAADKPIRFTIEDYAVVFSPEPVETMSPLKKSPTNNESSASIQTNPTRAADRQNLDIATRLQNSKFLYEIGKYDEAEEMVKQVIKDDPSNPSAPYYLDLIKEARSTDPNRQQRPWVQGESGQFGDSMSIPPRKPPSWAQTNLPWNTNLIYTSKGRQRILSQLDSITLNVVSFTQLPLKEVLVKLRKASVASDPDGIGVSFMINTAVVPASSSATNSGSAPAAVPAQDINIADEATINISPPLTNLRLVDVLDAITKAADKPICWTVEDYAVVFSPKMAVSNTLFIKRFRVDPNTFIKNLQNSFSGPDNVASAKSGTATNNSIESHKLVRAYFTAAGVNFTPPKMIFWNDRLGELMVRATESDLETIQRAIEILNWIDEKNESSASTQTNQPQTSAGGRVMIIGQVKTHFVPILPGKPKMLLEAVLESGPSDFANLRRVKLMRLDPATGSWKQSYFDLHVLENNPAKDVPVQDNDRITIPEKNIMFK